jgi:hypothetical protein
MYKTSNPGITEVNPGTDAIKKTHKFSYNITNKNFLFNNHSQLPNLNDLSPKTRRFYFP